MAFYFCLLDNIYSICIYTYIYTYTCNIIFQCSDTPQIVSGKFTKLLGSIDSCIFTEDLVQSIKEKYYFDGSFVAYENTWVGRRRRKRQVFM